MNKVELMGRLTRDIELKSTQSGVSVTAFTVAVDRRFKGQDGNRQTDFIDCVAWRQTAEFVSKYFSKGKMIALVGELQTRNYEDKDGNKRKAVEVNVEEVSFCGDKSDSGTSADAPVAVEAYEDVDDDDDELPF